MILVKQITVKLCFTNTHSIWTQFALSQEKKDLTFSLNSTCFKNTDTLLVQTLYMALQMSILMRFDFT